MKDTWCVLPWVHLCVRTGNVLKPCCRFINNSDSDVVDLDDVDKKGIDAMQINAFVDLRSRMLQGKKTPGCQKCYVQEAKNSGTTTSMRQYHNSLWSDVKKENCTTNFSHVRYLEMSVDNICNLECKMCESKFSSKLINRDMFLKNPVYKKLEPSFRKLDLVDLSGLEKVKILGGEPFITPNFSKFIDYLIERANPSNIFIDIVTNGTKIPSDSLIKKLNKFKSININISLDSYDKSNDYQRYGSNYLQTYKNSLKYKQIFENAEFSYHASITTLTANKLSKTLNFFENNEDHYSVDFVRYPEHLSLLYIPTMLAEWIQDKNKDNATALLLIKNFLKESEYNEMHWQKFIETTQSLDKYYNTELINYNPELYNFLTETRLF
jgi:sulfatase maturation enzyme AslB (radical SAM superfamily)